MTTDITGLSQDDHLPSETELRLRRSVRLGIWKRLLLRSAPAVMGFVIFGSILLETANRFLPTGGVLQSPTVVVLVTIMFLFPLVILSVKQLITLTVNLEMAHLQMLEILSHAIAKRDGATEEHNLRVAIMAVHLAAATGLDRCLIPGLFVGALLHDVGKIGVPDGILLKPGKLSPEERREMERHVVHGDEILAESTLPPGASRVVHYHHERFDGRGYPDGIKGAEIPPEARLFAIVDVFDALTSDRPYKKPTEPEEALRIMEGERGMHFDPACLDAFRTIVGTLHSEVVCIQSADLRKMALKLVEDHYRHGIFRTRHVTADVGGARN